MPCPNSGCASTATATERGQFCHTHIPWHSDRTASDAEAARPIAEARASQPLSANTGERKAVACLSCLPSMDFTALDNALPRACDGIPRVSREKIVETPAGPHMATSMEAHHGHVRGAHVGRFFAATPAAFDSV